MTMFTVFEDVLFYAGLGVVVLLVGVPVFVIRWVFVVVSVRCMGGFM